MNTLLPKSVVSKGSLPQVIPVGNQESAVYASNQILSFVVFGCYSLFSSLVFLQWDPLLTSSQWLCILCGPVIGLVLLLQAHKTVEKQADGEQQSSPYFAISLGSILGCFLLAAVAQRVWLIPLSFLFVAVLLGFLAWFEQSRVGMTAALSASFVSVTTGISLFQDGASLTIGLLGLLLLFGATALYSDSSEVVAGLELVSAGDEMSDGEKQDTLGTGSEEVGV